MRATLVLLTLTIAACGTPEEGQQWARQFYGASPEDASTAADDNDQELELARQEYDATGFNGLVTLLAEAKQDLLHNAKAVYFCQILEVALDPNQPIDEIEPVMQMTTESCGTLELDERHQLTRWWKYDVFHASNGKAFLTRASVEFGGF